VQTEFDNGGIFHGILAYAVDDDEEEDEEPTECEFQTTDDLPGTQSLNNLVPASSKLKRKWQEEMQLYSRPAIFPDLMVMLRTPPSHHITSHHVRLLIAEARSRCSVP
jgi:hypothetical protein